MTDDELHATLSRDEDHWWFRGRRRVLRAQLHRFARAREHSDLELTPSLLNVVLELPLRLESRVVATRTRLPAGLSLPTVLRRPSVREPMAA